MKHQTECIKPPEGWQCSRNQGHTGPCAATKKPNWFFRLLFSDRVAKAIYEDWSHREYIECVLVVGAVTLTFLNGFVHLIKVVYGLFL